MIIGIDPGKNGAVVGLGKSGAVLMTERMPKDIGSTAYILKTASPDFVVIEKAQAMPGQGVSSMFKYGCHFGEILGVLATLRIPHELVTPRTWTKAMHQGTAGGEPKKRSLEAARRLFPGVNLVPQGCRKPHDGIIDALLIAEWARRKNVG